MILDCARVEIGEKVMCVPKVQIYTATHPVLAAERIQGLELARPVTIGHNVWLGGGAIICPGVTIGDNTTIAAGSVVVKDIPANVLVVGNPCRVLRELKERLRPAMAGAMPRDGPAAAAQDKPPLSPSRERGLNYSVTTSHVSRYSTY